MIDQEVQDTAEELAYFLESEDGDVIVMVESSSACNVIKVVLHNVEINLYHSENNDRVWLDDKDDYEPLLDYCKREFKNIIDSLNKLSKLI